MGFHPDGRRIQPAEWPLARSLRTGEVVRGEQIDILRDDGRPGTVRVNSAPVRGPDGAIVAGVLVFDDTTEHRLAERAARASENQLEKIANALPALVSLVSPDRRYRFVNRMYSESWGQPVDKIVGASVESLVGPRHALTIRPHLDASLAGGAGELHGRVRLRRPAPHHERLLRPLLRRFGRGGRGGRAVDRRDRAEAIGGPARLPRRRDPGAVRLPRHRREPAAPRDAGGPAPRGLVRDRDRRSRRQARAAHPAPPRRGDAGHRARAAHPLAARSGLRPHHADRRARVRAPDRRGPRRGRAGAGGERPGAAGAARHARAPIVDPGRDRDLAGGGSAC